MSHPPLALWLAVVTLLGQVEPGWRSNWKFGPRLMPAAIAGDEGARVKSFAEGLLNWGLALMEWAS